MIRKLMMTVALAAAMFAASANEWTDSATGLTWSYDVVGDAAMIAGCSPTGTSLEIPQTIGGLPVTAIKVHALEKWTNLKSLTLHPVKIDYNGEDLRWLNLAFDPSNKPVYVHYTQTTITNITVRGGGVLPYCFFYECEAVESISFEGAFTGVEDQAFMRCRALKRIALPEGVEYVKNEAFRDCNALEEVRLPTCMTNIGSRVFTDDGNCLESLKRIYVSWDLYDAVKKQIDVGLDVEIIRIGDAPGSSPDHPWNVSPHGGITAFAYTNGVGGLVVYGSGAVRDDDYGDDLPWRTISDEIKTITIGKNITSIGRNAFSDLYSLTQVAFEEGSKLERIGDYAFSYSLQRMTELTLPSALKTIGEGAFYLCHPDLRLRIPASVNEIGPSAFVTRQAGGTYRGVREMVFEDGTSPISLAAFVDGSKVAFPKRLKVVIDGETGVPEQWRGNDGVLYATPKAAAEAGCTSVTAVLPLVDREFATVGEYVKFPLEDLGIPVDTNKYTIKAEGLPKGLSLVTEQIKNEQKKVVGYNYFIEGVPTETLVFATQKAYVRLTNADKTQTLYPLMLEVEPSEPMLVYDVILGKKIAEYVTEMFPQADASWTFKGWPTGIKYTTKAVKDKTFGELPPYVFYGTFTKAGRFTVTATAPVPGTKYKNTYTAILTVWPDQDARSRKDLFTHQAYAPFEPMQVGDVKSISGLPPGLKHTTKTLTDKTFGEIPAGTIYGRPTKAGVYTVTAKTFDGESAFILWTITPPDAPTFALDTLTVPIVETKAQVVQGANLAFPIATSDIAAKVTASGLPTGMKLVATPVKEGTKTVGNTYSVEGVATKPGDYRVTFKTVLNGVTTTSVVAFTVKGNPFTATYCGYACARPADGAAKRLAVAEVSVAAAGAVKLTYTEGKTKYTASVKSFGWDDATGKGTAEGLVLKVSSADRQLGYGDRKATVTFEDRGAYLKAKLSIADANGTGLSSGVPPLFETVKTTEVPLPASQTFVFRALDGGPLATVSVAYDAKKATAAFSGKLYDGTAVKATIPVTRWDDDGDSADYVFAPFLVISKDGTVYCFDGFSSGLGFVDVVDETGELPNNVCVDSVDYTLGDKKFAELVPATGAFTFNWGSDAEVVGAPTESFAFEVATDKNGNPSGVAIYDAEPQEGEKPLATVTAKVGKLTGAISVSFTSKKDDKAKYAVELVWRGDQLFAGHVTRTWKGVVDNKSANLTAYGTAEVK